MLLLESWGLENKDPFLCKADILGYLFPAINSRVFSSAWNDHLHQDILTGGPFENNVYIGVIVLLFAILGIWGIRQHSKAYIRFLVYMTACFLIMSMPVVAVGNVHLFYLPSVFLHYIPFINNLRAPVRNAIMVMLFLPVISSFGISAIRAKATTHVIRVGIGIVVLGLLVLEYVVTPFSLNSGMKIPSVYSALDTEGAIYEIPVGVMDGFKYSGVSDYAPYQMYYQTQHHHPILGAFISRVDSVEWKFLREEPILSETVRMEEDTALIFPPVSLHALNTFTTGVPIHYIIIDPQYRHGNIENFILQSFAPKITSQQEIDGYLLLTL